MTDRTTIEESLKMIFRLPMAQVQHTDHSIRQAAQTYLRTLCTLARARIGEDCKAAGEDPRDWEVKITNEVVEGMLQLTVVPQRKRGMNPT